MLDPLLGGDVVGLVDLSDLAAGHVGLSALDLNVLSDHWRLDLEQDDAVSHLESLVAPKEGLDDAGLVTDHHSVALADVFD